MAEKQARGSQPPTRARSEITTVCLVGATGAGKSTTGNTLLGCRADDLFTVGGGATRVTTRANIVEGVWAGEPAESGARLRVVDTPGLLDTEGQDAEHLRDIANHLTEVVGEVDVFLVLFNSKEQRLNDAVLAMLEVFGNLFSKAFLKNVMLGFTQWDYEPKARLKRKKRFNVGVEGEQRQMIAAEVNQKVREVLGHKFDSPCLYIDNSVNYQDDEDLEELFDDLDGVEKARGQLAAELRVLRDFAESRSPFDCRGVSSLRAERAKDVQQLMGHYLQLGPSEDDDLGRRLIRVDQDVLWSGRLWYRRRWVHGRLRRQCLRLLFADGGPVEPDMYDGSEDVNLLGAICAPQPRLIFSRQQFYFCLYRPHAERLLPERFRFGVTSERDQSQWIKLIMDATQVSEGCRAVGELHHQLRNAASEADYISTVQHLLEEQGTLSSFEVSGAQDVPGRKLSTCNGEFKMSTSQGSRHCYTNQSGAIVYFEREWRMRFPGDTQAWAFSAGSVTSGVMSFSAGSGVTDFEPACGRWAASSEEGGAVTVASPKRTVTMIIPVEWMRQFGESEVVKRREPHDLRQLEKDLQRETLQLDKGAAQQPEAVKLAEEIAMRILHDREASPDEVRTRASAMALARDAVLSCSRTVSGGAAIAAMEQLFQNEDHVSFVHDVQFNEPIAVDVLKAKSKLEALRRVDDDSGVFEIGGSSSSSLKGSFQYGFRATSSIAEKDVAFAGQATRKEKWVGDHEAPQCQICEIPFSMFLRRHHCRSCGRVVCSSCSQHKIHLTSAAPAGDTFVGDAALAQVPEDGDGDMHRVCYNCYTDAFVRALNARKDSIVSEEEFGDDGGEADDEPDSDEEPGEGGESPGSGKAASFRGAEDAEEPPDTWPGISVTMDMRFKVISCNSPDLTTIFRVHCRYLRVIRWSGRQDEGRVLATIEL